MEGGILLELEGPGYLSDYRARVALLDRSGRTYTGDTAYGNPIAVCNLPSGSYRLYVHGDCDAEPWASQWYDGADSLAAASFIEVVAGHATRATLHLDHDGRIEGRVLDNAGLPAPVRLALYRGGAPLCENLYAVGWNPFSIRGLGNGDYTLAAVLLDDALWWYPGTAFPDSARILRIRNHGTLTGIEWRLPALDTGVRP